MIFRRTIVAIMLPIVCLTAACEGDGAGNASIGRDSAGITIVENSRNTWTEKAAWRVDPKPVSIGRVDGPPEYQLYRVVRALRLADGTIVVANGGSRQIRFYDSTGTHIRSVGGEGAGPGEYQFISFLRRFGADSLVVWDGPLDRGTVLAIDGTYGRNIRRPNDESIFVYYVDAFADGSLLCVWDQGVRPETEPTGRRRNDAVLFRLTKSGELDRIGSFFSSESYITPEKSLISMPFGRRAVYAVARDLVYYGSSESHEVRTYTGRGKLVRITRSARVNAP